MTSGDGDRHSYCLDELTLSGTRRISILAGIILCEFCVNLGKCMDVKIISDIFFSLPVTSEIYCFHDCLNTWLHPPSPPTFTLKLECFFQHKNDILVKDI